MQICITCVAVIVIEVFLESSNFRYVLKKILLKLATKTNFFKKMGITYSLYVLINTPDAYLGPQQTPMIKLFPKVVNDYKI